MGTGVGRTVAAALSSSDGSPVGATRRHATTARHQHRDQADDETSRHDHRGNGARNSRIAAASRSGTSIPIMCATSGQTTARAFGAFASTNRAATAHLRHVEVAGDGQHRAAQLCEPAGSRRLEPDPIAGRSPGRVAVRVHLEHERTDRRGDSVARLPGAVDPDARIDLGDGSRVGRLGRVEAVHLREQLVLERGRAAIEAAEPRGHADHGDDAVRGADRGVEGGHPAHRVADQGRPSDAQRIEHREQVVDA